MRTALTLIALGLCALTTGCRLAVHIARNLSYEPMRYTDDVVECCRNQSLARTAWDQAVEANGGKAFSRDYERGFKDGYADYLRLRGPGLPPPVPPKCYWNQRYQTPEGHAAIEDWYAGFAHGAQAARDSWRSPFLTVPSHAEGPDPIRPTAHDAVQEASEPPAAEMPPPKPVKELPAEPLKKEPVKTAPPLPLPEAPKAEAAPPLPLAPAPLPTLQSSERGTRNSPYSVIPRPAGERP